MTDPKTWTAAEPLRADATKEQIVARWQSTDGVWNLADALWLIATEYAEARMAETHPAMAGGGGFVSAPQGVGGRPAPTTTVGY
jgi:hypothetical protein